MLVTAQHPIDVWHDEEEDELQEDDRDGADTTPDGFPEDDYAECELANAMAQVLGARADAQCQKCRGKHHIVDCQEFRRMSGVDRCLLAREYRLCLVCAEAGHVRSNCPKRSRARPCQSEQCKGGYHHPVFCPFQDRLPSKHFDVVVHSCDTQDSKNL